MSVAIEMAGVVKCYGNNTVIPNLDLKVREGEFFTLLGPSGCGKTTLLRMIAGFNTMEGGTISFNGKVINELPPGKRNIGMVFQNYAIFPHLTVWKNVAFGLTNQKLDKTEIRRRVDEVLEQVQIKPLANRMPAKMSGGQQQRIALARAIVIRPDVLLMDEPLSNLDAKLRTETRDVIKEIQNKVGITTIYVTHDQEEAMAVSDRIAVMKDGVVQQVGTPREIYHRPENVFVSTFIGASNIIPAVLCAGEDGKALLKLGAYHISVPGVCQPPDKALSVRVSVRPEEFILGRNSEGISGRILSSIFLGASTHYTVALETGDRIRFIQHSRIGGVYENGRMIRLVVDADSINVYSEDGATNYRGEVQG